MPGAKLNENEYQKILQKIDAIEDAEFLVASGSLPPEAPEDFYVKVAGKAKRKGLKFVLDTSGKALPAILKEGAYLLKPSIDELEDLTETATGNEAEQKALLLEVLNQYKVEIIVLSLGAKGALLAHGNSVEYFPAVEVEARSSIGAGDSMVAGIVFSLSLGKTLREALLFGSACGAATLKTPGTQLLHKEDAERIFKKLMTEDR
jgi:6-phosphofructokinase 2